MWRAWDFHLIVNFHYHCKPWLPLSCGSWQKTRLLGQRQRIFLNMLIAIVRILAFSYASSLSPSSHTTLQRGPGDSCVYSRPHFSKDVLSLGNSDVLKQVVCTYLLFPKGNLNSLYWAICLQEILYLPRQKANLLWSNTPNLLRLLNR